MNLSAIKKTFSSTKFIVTSTSINDLDNLDKYYESSQNFHGKSASSYSEHLSKLDIDSEPHTVRQSGIICTVGPACRDVPKMMEMIKDGLNIARLNFSHDTHEYHAESIKNIREATDKLKDDLQGRPVAIAIDTKGPEIRTGLVKGSITTKVELIKNREITITVNPEFAEKCDENTIYVGYSNLINIITPGKKIYIDDGLISLSAKQINKDSIVCEIENGGTLFSRKGVNLPGIPIDLPAVSDADRLDLQFAVEQNVDIIFASFIHNAEGVRDVRKALGEKGKDILVIAKIETHQGVENFDDILKESDGILVSRGDLGIEIPLQKVFIAQKMMISRCNKVGKPIICATQMLDSMTHKPRPTRAEVSDVANAVLDGADCVMLSGETAKGEYPLESLRMMHAIAREAESAIYHKEFFQSLRYSNEKLGNNLNSISIAAVEASYHSAAAAIIVLTISGVSAQTVSKYRPRCPIIAVTRNRMAARQLHLWRGVFPIYIDEPEVKDLVNGDEWISDVQCRVDRALQVGVAKGLLKKGDNYVLINGWRGGSGNTNTLRILQYL